MSLVKPLIFRFILGLLVVVSSSCVTTKMTVKHIPNQVRKHFGRCSPSEGSALFSETNYFNRSSQIALDWVNPDGNSWRLQITDPFGRILSDVIYSKGDLKLEQSKDWMPKVYLAASGELMIEGYASGFKGAELPCLLRQKFPRTWLNSLIAVKKSARSATMNFEFDDFDLELILESRNVAGGYKNFCLKIKRSLWFGLSQAKISWCFEQKSKVNQVILPSGKSMYWKILDD